MRCTRNEFSIKDIFSEREEILNGKFHVLFSEMSLTKNKNLAGFLILSVRSSSEFSMAFCKVYLQISFQNYRGLISWFTDKGLFSK